MTRAPSSAPPASFGVVSSIPQMLMKNFVLRPSFFASFRMTAVELVVPPIHAKSAPLFFTERSWEFASIAFRSTFSSPRTSNPSSFAYSLPPLIGAMPYGWFG